MTTINATKGEFVNLINGLFAVSELKGKDFSLTVSENIKTLKEKLEDLENAGRPSDEFMELAKQVNEIANEDSEDSKERIDKLEEENKELVDSRRKQMDEVTEMMLEEVSIDLKPISRKVLPEDITAKQISNLDKIIK